MKKNKLIIYCFLLLLFATYSCQYEEATTEKDLLAEVNPLILKHDLSAYKIKPIWESAIVFKKGDVVEMTFKADDKIILPLSDNRKIQGRQRLLLTIEKGIVRATIIEYIPADTFVGDIKYINSGNFKVKQFDGKVTIRNIKDDFKMVWYLTKGEIVGKAMQYKIKNNSNNKGDEYDPNCDRVVVCIQHPGAGDMECSIVITCPDTSGPDPYDPNTDPYGPNYDPWIIIHEGGYDPYPNGGSGGGGGGNSGNENESCATNFNNLMSSSAPASELISSITTLEDSETRTKTYMWKFHTSPSFALYSHDLGVHRKVSASNPNLAWEWESLTHLNASKSGQTVGFDVSFSVNSAVPTVGRYNSVMDLNYNVKFSATCFGVPATNELNFNSAKIFNVNE